MYTPHDVAFVELCIVATLTGVDVTDLEGYMDVYQDALLLAQDHPGWKECVVPPKPPSTHPKSLKFCIRTT